MNQKTPCPSFPIITIDQAVEILQSGDVVAIPTETVYGLGAWIYSDEGLRKIFSVKERPFFDPLIVHIDHIEKARSLSADWTEIHEVLATSCWPGPLTLITKKKPTLNSLITAGLDSVGLRCPNHPLTLQILSRLEGGIAAPSANKFGKTSPTHPSHVQNELENISIIDGGACEIGIESTVVGIERNENSYRVEIFRPGFFTAQMISTILKNHHFDNISVHYSQSPVAPGQLKHHYMPAIPLVLIPEGMKMEEAQGLNYRNPALWKQPSDPLIASRELYEKMRKFDEEGYDIIFAEKSPRHDKEEWFGIWNRLEKAKTYSFLR